jgi:hypothetical protein
VGCDVLILKKGLFVEGTRYAGVARSCNGVASTQVAACGGNQGPNQREHEFLAVAGSGPLKRSARIQIEAVLVAPENFRTFHRESACRKFEASRQTMCSPNKARPSAGTPAGVFHRGHILSSFVAEHRHSTYREHLRTGTNSSVCGSFRHPWLIYHRPPSITANFGSNILRKAIARMRLEWKRTQGLVNTFLLEGCLQHAHCVRVVLRLPRRG